MTERIVVIAMAFLLDILLGDPHGWWHPIQGIGKIIEIFEKMLRRFFHLREEWEEDKRKKQMAGAVLVMLVLAVSVGVPALLLYGAEQISHYLSLLLETIMCYQLLAMKSLKTESMKVYYALCEGDVEKGRRAVSMIVGRDTESLDQEGIVKAAVETVAENTSDGVIAPMIFMLIFGVLGGFFYKAVNTMDSMVGYKNDRYCYLGTVAAKLDDILNFIPARISAGIMILTAGILGMDRKNAWRIYKRDRYQHASPNSAQTEAACAGALGVQLAGDAYYFGKLYHKPTIGDAIRSIEIEDIRRANRLLYGTGILVCLMGVAALWICSAYRVGKFLIFLW